MRSVLVTCLLLASLVAPLNAAATHELPDPVDTLREAAAGVSRTVGNNAPVFVSGRLLVDADSGTWQIDCGPFVENCFFSVGGALDPDTHLGPLDTAPCPVRRGTGTGRFNPPSGTFGGPYDAVELHDLRITVLTGGVVLEGAWRDDAGRGDRFAALLAALPAPVSAAGCHVAGSRQSIFTGWAWPIGIVR